MENFGGKIFNFWQQMPFTIHWTKTFSTKNVFFKKEIILIIVKDG